MTNAQPNFDPGAETEKKFSGEWLSLNIANVTRLQHAVNRGELSLSCFRIEEALPAPLTDLNMLIDQRHDTTIGNLSASVEFDLNLLPNILDFDSSELWQHHIVDAVGRKTTQSFNTYSIYTLPHEGPVSYVIIDDIHTLRIEANTLLAQCTISVELVATDMLQRELGQEPPADRGEIPTNKPYDVIMASVQALVHATDEVMNWSKVPYKDANIIQRTVHLTPNDNPSPDSAAVPAVDDDPEATVPEAEKLTTRHNPFDFIGGATHAKERLQEISLALKHPTLAKQYDISADHFLLYGPAGTGKTSLVRAFAEHIDAELLEYDSTYITSKWVGDSGKQMKMVFNQARKIYEEINQPVVIFIDEFDSIAPGGRSGTAERQDIKNIIKSQLVELSKTHPQIVFAAASNEEIGNFDEALVRAGRLEPIYVPKPDLSERKDIWKAVLLQSLERFGALTISENSVDSAVKADPYDINLDFDELAQLTEGMTGADFTKILAIARQRKFLGALATGQKADINQYDIKTVINSYTPGS